MKTGIKIFFTFLLIAGFLVSCSSTKIYKRPQGSVIAINTAGNDLAPMQKSIHNKTCSPCIKEFRTPKKPDNDGVKPSKDFLQEMMDIDYEIHPEALCYVDADYGFFAISHPPDTKSSD